MQLLARLAPATLTNRIFALYAMMMLLLVGGGMGLFLKYQFNRQIEETEMASVMLIEVVVQSVQDSVVIGDYDSVQKILTRGVQGSEFSQAMFISTDGGKLRALNHSEPRAQAPAWLTRRVGESLDDVNRNVSVGGKDYGIVRLQFDTQFAAGNLWWLTRWTVGLSLASLMAGLILMRWALARWLGGLERLRATVETLGTDTAHAQNLVIANAPAEIQSLVDMVNQTAALIRERESTRLALDQQKFALDQHAIVSITDRSGIITYANDRFCEISGYARDELLGQNHRILKSGEHAPEVYADMWHTIVQGRVWHGEICNRKRNGDLYWVSATIVPLLGADGFVERYIGIRTDITERKAIESSLNVARTAAEQASQAKSQFLANMSHEIRTPMNAILGLLAMLQSTHLDPQQLDYTVKTEGAAKSLLGLLNDILDFSKVEAGKMELDPHPFRLAKMMQDLLIVVLANVGSKPVAVRLDLDPQLPEGVCGDDMRLRQVLINLGGNAVKFTSRGEVVLKVAVVERSDADVLLAFSVRDTGIGIAPDKQAFIFDGFSQAESSTTRRFGGTGLGLAISQRLVLLMGGTLQLDSTPGLGSTFHFQIRLPLAQLAPPSPTPTPVAGAGTVKRLDGVRILLVEDNKINQMVAKGLLGKEGAVITVADNGRLGVEALQSRPDGFDLVLMDLQMPEMDGFAATQFIRQGLALESLPIVAMTANAMASDRQACLDAGMNDHVGKPFQIDQLVATIRHYVPEETGTSS